jgi:hypothetical protein
MIAMLVDDGGSSTVEKSSVDNRGEDAVRSNPGVALIDHTTLPQLKRNAIEDVVPYIFLVCQNLMDCAPIGRRSRSSDRACRPTLAEPIVIKAFRRIGCIAGI